MRQLLWKEWHEQAWKLAFGSLVLSAVAAIGLHARMTPDSAMVDWVCFLGLTLLPVLASTGLVPAERGEGTLESLVALPVPAWRVLAAKTALGLVLCVGPIAVAGAVAVAMAGGREVRTAEVVAVHARSAATAAALFVWMLALTIRLPTETRAALVAVGVLVLWMLASAALAFPAVRATGFAASPFAFVWSFADDMGPGPGLALSVGVQGVLLTAAWLLAWRAFAASAAEGQS